MDLGAYANIPSLESLLLENRISVQRLRGIRLMSTEKAISRHEIEENVARASIRAAENKLCECAPNCYEYSDRTRRLKEKYLVYDYVPYKWKGRTELSLEPVAIRWNKLHGWRKKQIRFAIKQKRRAIERQYEVFNRYAGQPGVLMIHARIGAGNWIDCGGPELARQPWFIEKVDDACDDTYVDIYARIKEPERTPESGSDKEERNEE